MNEWDSVAQKSKIKNKDPTNKTKILMTNECLKLEWKF